MHFVINQSYFFGKTKETDCIDENALLKTEKSSKVKLKKRSFREFNYAKANQLFEHIITNIYGNP